MNRKFNYTIPMHNLIEYRAFQIGGSVWIICDEGYDDDDGFSKSYWTFGKMISGYTYEAWDYVPDVSSFNRMADAVASFNAKIKPKISTDGYTQDEQRKVA